MTWLAYSHRFVAKRVVVTQQPGNAQAGVAFNQQPVVRLVDGGGEYCEVDGVTIIATKHSGVVGTLSGTTSVQTVKGIATFTDLQMSGAETGVTIDFNSSGLIGVTSGSFDVASGASSLVGHWNWNTATGWTTNAARDTGKAVPLTLFNGGNGGVDIASVAGKNFPAGINNGVRNNRTSGAVFDWCGCQNLWAAPTTGNSLFGRMYMRNEISSNASQAYGACHPVESYGADSGGYNFDGNGGYSFKIGNNTDGTWQFVVATYGTGTQYYWGFNQATPANSSTNPALNKNHTYRIEWAFTRGSGNIYTLQLRLYNEAGTLIASGTDWKDNFNGGGVGLDNSRTTIMVDTSIRGFRVGTNGGWGVGSSQYMYYSGLAFSTTDWCGPYTSAENS